MNQRRLQRAVSIDNTGSLARCCGARGGQSCTFALKRATVRQCDCCGNAVSRHYSFALGGGLSQLDSVAARNITDAPYCREWEAEYGVMCEGAVRRGVLRRAGTLLRIGLASFDATSETRDF